MNKFIISSEHSNQVRTIPLDCSLLIVGDEKRLCYYALKLSNDVRASEIDSFLSSIKHMPCSKSELFFYLGFIEEDQTVIRCREYLSKFKILPRMIDCSGQSLDFYFDSLRIIPALKVKQKKKVLIVDDSISMVKILERMFKSLPNVEIVGIAGDVSQAIELIAKTSPDLVSLDMILPKGTGLDVLKAIDVRKTKTILVSDCSNEQGGLVFSGLAMGALTYFKKPAPSELQEFQQKVGDFMTEIFKTTNDAAASNSEVASFDYSKKSLIAIGSSTGGTEVVRDFLRDMPKKCPPILIVQHMPATFTPFYAERLTRESGRRTIEVKGEIELKWGEAYLAAGGTHIKIKKSGERIFVVASDGPLVNRFKPSISVLFESLYQHNMGKQLIAIMLSGMGRDGAAEMLQLKNQGAISLGQSEASCIVYGMPRAAKELDALHLELSPESMVREISGGLKRCG